MCGEAELTLKRGLGSAQCSHTSSAGCLRRPTAGGGCHSDFKCSPLLLFLIVSDCLILDFASD